MVSAHKDNVRAYKMLDFKGVFGFIFGIQLLHNPVISTYHFCFALSSTIMRIMITTFLNIRRITRSLQFLPIHSTYIHQF